MYITKTTKSGKFAEAAKNWVVSTKRKYYMENGKLLELELLIKCSRS